MTAYLDGNFDLNSDNLVEVFDELPIWAAPFGLKLLDNVIYRKNIVALDIGFGAGFPLIELSMRLGETSKVYGIDPWEAATRRAKKKINLYGIKNIEIIHGIAEDIPLEENSIDLITSNNGINNVSDINKSLIECSRILKSGGQFIMSMNLNNSMNEFYSVMKSVLHDLKMEAEIVKMQEQIYKKRKPLEEISELIEKHGFIIDKIINDQFDYMFADGTSMFNHFFIRLAFLDGWKSIIPENNQLVVFTRIESEMNKQAENNGFIKLSIPFVVIDCKKS